MYFLAGKNAEVLFYRTELKVTSVSDPVDIFTNKLQQFVRQKNDEVSESKK